MSNDNLSPTEDEVAALARRFWEEEGQPEGRAEEHWRRAEAQLRGEAPNPEDASILDDENSPPKP